MRISQKILLYMLPLVILPLLLLGGFSYFSLKNNTEQQVKSRLNNYLAQNRQQIQSYYKTIESTQVLLSKSNLLEQYYDDTDALQKDAIRPLLIDAFSQYASSYQDFYEIRLLTPEGIEDVRYSTDISTNVTQDESQTDYFTLISNMTDEQGVFLITNPDNDETALICATKITNASAVGGFGSKLMGVSGIYRAANDHF